MKIVNAFENRELVETACGNASACVPEYKALREAANRIDFDNVLYRNFYWCVEKHILEEWLPGEIPADVPTVSASGCTGLTKITAPNAEYVSAGGCTGLTKPGRFGN